MNEEERKKDQKEVEEVGRLNLMAGDLSDFLQSFGGRRSQVASTEWKRQQRRRGGLGGRGFTKSLLSEKQDKLNKKRRKTAKASKRSQRKNHPSRISRTGRRK